MKEITELKEIQRIGVKLLEAFADYCEKNRLTYYLAWGTLLGAVRHQGFIPWDDDVDVMMPREDYDRLIARFQSAGHDVIGEDVRIVHHQIDERYIYVNARVYDARTVIENGQMANPAEHGIWITLFPVDAIPDGRLERAALLFRLKIDCTICNARMRKKGFQSSFPKAFVIRALRRAYAGARGERKLQRTLSYMRRYADQDGARCAILSLGNGYKFQFDRAWFAEATSLTFEGRAYPAPVGYDRILRTLYGDYMTPPPTSQRAPKHDYRAFWKGME